MKTSSNPACPRLSLIIAGSGLAVSAYLLFYTFSLLSSEHRHGADVCRAVFGGGCEEALLSDQSWVLGVPLAAWGVVFYAMIICLLIQSWLLHDRFLREGHVAALVLASLGFAASIGLTVILFSGMAPFCPLCLVVHAINSLLLPVMFLSGGYSFRDITNSLTNALRYAAGGHTAEPVASRWKVFALLCPLLLATVVYQWAMIETRALLSTSAAVDPEDVIADFQRASERQIEISDSDPRRGPPDAAVTMVVFSSFQCSWCRSFSRTVEQLADHYEEELLIVFKHFPLRGACESTEDASIGCQAAWAAVAAQQQNAFWPYHDRLFESDSDLSPSRLVAIAEALGLDRTQFTMDQTAAESLAKVKSDIQYGNELGVDGTPTVFLNGRKLQDTGEQSLKILIDHCLHATSGPDSTEHDGHRH